ncbi:hypothetical protein CEUSTIGMA_g2679.t1 [Chlamydomonas eustigma]|uniref:Uncharacterized protein n=1 Tax=Chlamydomonas eustigma TaxID=1157962 RepID=A0A250WWM6_9CHLO|nr:hypothetical protein CEUSTIGMA_g2679.t1 [Chlamydomonas eustigma]|eukprot:GAX75234.1 hypothetical protein CEUSTIGMA_g2679.t1 [Chlamydomonas eustigma]
MFLNPKTDLKKSRFSEDGFHCFAGNSRQNYVPDLNSPPFNSIQNLSAPVSSSPFNSNPLPTATMPFVSAICDCCGQKFCVCNFNTLPFERIAHAETLNTITSLKYGRARPQASSSLRNYGRRQRNVKKKNRQSLQSTGLLNDKLMEKSEFLEGCVKAGSENLMLHDVQCTSYTEFLGISDTSDNGPLRLLQNQSVGGTEAVPSAISGCFNNVSGGSEELDLRHHADMDLRHHADMDLGHHADIDIGHHADMDLGLRHADMVFDSSAAWLDLGDLGVISDLPDGQVPDGPSQHLQLPNQFAELAESFLNAEGDSGFSHTNTSPPPALPHLISKTSPSLLQQQLLLQLPAPLVIWEQQQMGSLNTTNSASSTIGSVMNGRRQCQKMMLPAASSPTLCSGEAVAPPPYSPPSCSGEVVAPPPYTAVAPPPPYQQPFVLNLSINDGSSSAEVAPAAGPASLLHHISPSSHHRCTASTRGYTSGNRSEILIMQDSAPARIQQQTVDVGQAVGTRYQDWSLSLPSSGGVMRQDRLSLWYTGMVNPRSDSPSAETNDHVAVGASLPSSPLPAVRASLPSSPLPVRASLSSSPLPVRASLPSSTLPVRASLSSSTLPAAHMDSTALFQELSTWPKTLSGMAAASTFLDANVPSAVAAAAEVLHFSRFSAGQRCTRRKDATSLAAPHQDHYASHHSQPTC